jgi:hypothetical protein
VSAAAPVALAALVALATAVALTRCRGLPAMMSSHVPWKLAQRAPALVLWDAGAGAAWTRHGRHVSGVQARACSKARGARAAEQSAAARVAGVQTQTQQGALTGHPGTSSWRRGRCTRPAAQGAHTHTHTRARAHTGARHVQHTGVRSDARASAAPTAARAHGHTAVQHGRAGCAPPPPPLLRLTFAYSVKQPEVMDCRT